MTQIRALSKITLGVFFFVIALGTLFLLPNFFPDRPIVEFYAPLNEAQLQHWQGNYQGLSIEQKEDKLVFLPQTIEQQLEIFQELRKAYPDQQVNLNLRSQVPQVLSSLGFSPMKLGLDLRGGVHFLLSVDTDSVIEKKFHNLDRQLQSWLKEQAPTATVQRLEEQSIEVSWPTLEEYQKSLPAIAQQFPEYQVLPFPLEMKIQLIHSPFYESDERLSLMQTTLTSLRQRVNELGVAEASIYTQGQEYIVVDLPGIQDVHQAKALLGKTATVEFYFVSNKQLKPGAPVPPGVHRKKDKHGQSVDLVGRPLLAGQDIMLAQANTTPEGRPCVDLRISPIKAREFRRVTAENIGRMMAVLYVEFYSTQRWDQQKQEFVSVPQMQEKVLSVARIESALGDRFQITGLSREASLDIALMLRAGSLPAPVHIAEEKILGPSMGVENIRMGLSSLALGLGLIASFMLWYYRRLGVVTNLVLVCNLVVLIMSLSLIQATLTLPGIAGVVLTLGMAVDANVIIFERVRDELRRGVGSWEALDIGLDRAAETIIDSNITTMIIGVVLFFLGSGTVKGFAITLILGLLTSVFTALVGTRVFIYLFYHRQHTPDLRFLFPHTLEEAQP